MKSAARTVLFWQIAGGVVAGMFILAFVAELIWWPLYLNDRHNVTLPLTFAVHIFSAFAVVTLYAYMRSKRRRQSALERADVQNFNAIAFRRRIFGFDLDVQWLFPAVVLMLSIGSDGPMQFTIFAAAVVIVILIHELGHAFMAKRLGGEDIRILLHSLGGLTQFDAPFSRRRNALVAISGPVTGFGLAAVVALLGAVSPEFRATPLYSNLLFITFGWSAMNVLPILPLDGGILLATVIDRQPLVMFLSVLFAVLGAMIAAANNRLGFVLFFVVLAISNFLVIPRVATTIARINQRFG